MKKTFLIIILSLLFVLPANTKTNIPVPFTSQAPYSNWNEPWQNACEEASIIMVNSFYSGINTKKIDKAQARDNILHILNIKNKKFGYSLDENVDKIITLINDYLFWEAKKIENPTLEQIKNEINNNRPVIIPVHGKSLLNPYFQQGGPEYHVLVISGYDDETQNFITQEPGTRHGLDFLYPYDRIINALHDFVPRKTITGAKLAIFTRRDIINSGDSDGDEDNLTKSEELKYGTLLWQKDSDGDGYGDGTEVRFGYSPIVDETKLGVGSLIKKIDNPKVYLIDENREKRHIVSGEVFIRHGWSWGDIKVVGERFFDRFEEGKKIKD
jgi:hypothetical protein